MVCRAVVAGIIPDEPMDLEVRTEVSATILNNGATVSFSFENEEAEAGLQISQFYFSFSETVNITSSSSSVPGGAGEWLFDVAGTTPCGATDLDWGFRALTPDARLSQNQSGTFTVNAAAGTFTEDLLDGLQVCLVYERGASGTPGFVQGCVCGSWVCDNGNGGNGVICPFDRSLARMELALARLLNNVQRNASFPEDLPEVEKILKLVFLKNQLITILAQECRPAPDNSGGGGS